MSLYDTVFHIRLLKAWGKIGLEIKHKWLIVKKEFGYVLNLEFIKEKKRRIVNKFMFQIRPLQFLFFVCILCDIFQ